MTAEEDWVREAMTDDAVVVEMLLRLHADDHLPPPPKRKAMALEWTVRQRRSRPAARLLADSSNSTTSNSGGGKKKAETARASPTTPLSWSGATSNSGGGGADRFEESSRPARSKVFAGASETTNTKRSRKKKTLAELKDEESLLLKEKITLKTELATLRLRLENQRSTNESLKKMKLDYQSHHTFKTATSEETISDHVQCHSTLQHNSSAAQEVESRGTGFLLPDLNLPLEEDSCSNVVLCAMS